VELIPLKAYRIAPRKPWVAVVDGLVTFRLPGFLGKRTFSTPIGNVGAVDPRLLGESAVAEDVVYEMPIVVPYAYTTSATTAPNVGVVFREPVAVPTPLLLRQRVDELAPKRGATADLPAGRYVDGLLLRAVDPDTAIETLAVAGAERVVDPDAFFAAHRAIESDPREIARAERAERVSGWLEWALYPVLGTGLAVAAFGGITGREPLVDIGMIGAVGAGALTVAWDWWMQRRAFRRKR